MKLFQIFQFQYSQKKSYLDWILFFSWFTHFYIVGSSLSCALLWMLIIHCFHIKSPITEYFPQILDLHYTPCVNYFTVLVSLLLLLVQCCRRLFECLFISVFTGKIHLSHYLVGLFYYVLDAIALASPLLGKKKMDKGKFVQLYFYEIFVRELAWMNQILRHFLQSEHLKAFKICQRNCNLFKALANLITKQVILPIRNLTISVTFAVIFNALSSLCADILSLFFKSAARSGRTSGTIIFAKKWE